MSEKNVVRVTYSVDECFKIPSNIDLENEEQVDCWYVKWNILHIMLTNGKMLEIESEGWFREFDLKRPSDDPVIEPAEYVGLDDEEADLNNDNEKENPK